jgi:hypothetical protein
MGRNSTRFYWAFFSVVLLAFLVIQFCWIQSVQGRKLRDFSHRSILAIEDTKIALTPSTFKELNQTIAARLRQSFAEKGLHDIHFEFSIGQGDNRLSSQGFTSKKATDPANLTLLYPLKREDPAGQQAWLTLVIPAWQHWVLQDMKGTFAICLSLTIMVLVIFYQGILLNNQKWINSRTDSVVQLMQQLETPLNTLSAAAEALGNDTVMANAAKRDYYQQVIHEASDRMNDRVNKIISTEQDGQS